MRTKMWSVWLTWKFGNHCLVFFLKTILRRVAASNVWQMRNESRQELRPCDNFSSRAHPLSLPLLIDWQAFCSPVRPTECLLVRKCVNLQGNLICVCGLCEGTWILNGNFDSLREIPMNYELYLCILPISILFVTVGIPNLINYIYISYVCVCVLSVLFLWRCLYKSIKNSPKN